MSSAQTNIKATNPMASARASLPWGKWGLRGTAFLYLGFMIALPLAAISFVILLVIELLKKRTEQTQTL